MEKVYSLHNGDEQIRQQYYALLIAQNPQKLLALSSQGTDQTRDAATQYAIVNAPPALALNAIKARGDGLPPVWTAGYSALTGLYLNQLDSTTGEAFRTVLGDAPIAERIGKAVDRSQQLAGSTWFYYGSRYGEYLGLTGAANAEDYLPSNLELQPESPEAHAQLGAWYGDHGEPSEALEEYNAALQLRPSDPMIYDRMALLLWQQGRKADALSAWKNAVSLVAGQIDARKVPQSFWTDFATVVGHLGSHDQFPAIRSQVDTMLRIYIKRNGSYMTEPLLQAIYKATRNPANATTWILELSAFGNPPDAVVDAVVNTTWIGNAQRPRIYARLVEVARENMAPTEGEARIQAASRLRYLQIQWIDSLLKIGDYPAAKQVLDAVPGDERQSFQAQWLPVELKMAAHEGTLTAMIQRWKQDPASAPPVGLLRNAASNIDKPAKNIVLEYVYQTAIDAHDLAASNFLGLAEIRIDQGDTAAAISLLQRMVLVSADQYADLDSAAALLMSTGHDSEAIPFLMQLTIGVPWQPAYRLRLDTARLKANQEAVRAIDDLAAVAKDRSAAYDVRTDAAQAISGRRAEQNLGSAELDLLTHTSVSSADAQHSYFIAARIVAAKGAPLTQRVSLLRQIIEINPRKDTARVALLRAALDAKDAHLAINTAQTFLGQNDGTADAYSRIGDSSDEMIDQPEPVPDMSDSDAGSTGYDSGPNAFYHLARAERARLLAGIAESYRQIDEPAVALTYFRRAGFLESEPDRQKIVATRITQLRSELHRRAIDAQRAPQIHDALDQNHAVQPRLQAAAERKER